MRHPALACLVCEAPTTRRDVDGDPVCLDCDDLTPEPLLDPPLFTPSGGLNSSIRTRVFVGALDQLRRGIPVAAVLAFASAQVGDSHARSLVRNAQLRIAYEARATTAPPGVARADLPKATRTPNAERLDQIAQALGAADFEGIMERLEALLVLERHNPNTPR